MTRERFHGLVLGFLFSLAFWGLVIYACCAGLRDGDEMTTTTNADTRRDKTEGSPRQPAAPTVRLVRHLGYSLIPDVVKGWASIGVSQSRVLHQVADENGRVWFLQGQRHGLACRFRSFGIGFYVESRERVIASASTSLALAVPPEGTP